VYCLPELINVDATVTTCCIFASAYSILNARYYLSAVSLRTNKRGTAEFFIAEQIIIFAS
jgi:hypothetical protein